MWLPIVAGVIGVAVYRKRRFGDPLGYPSWSGRLLNSTGGMISPLKLNYLKIDHDGELWSKGSDMAGDYKLRGYLRSDGTVEFVKKYITGTKNEVEFKGRIVAHGRIAGNWSVVGGVGTGQFELELERHQMYTMRRHKDSETFIDKVSLALSPNRKKFRGVGLDQMGPYFIKGTCVGDNRIEGSLNYLGKFTIEYEAIKNAVTGDYEGKWRIKNGGEGTFNLRRDNQGPEFQNVPYLGQMISAPLNNTQVNLQPQYNQHPVYNQTPQQQQYGYPHNIPQQPYGVPPQPQQPYGGLAPQNPQNPYGWFQPQPQQPYGMAPPPQYNNQQPNTVPFTYIDMNTKGN